MAVTLQGIDSNWTLFNLPIAFTPIYGPHTAEAVGKLIASALTPFLGIAYFYFYYYFYFYFYFILMQQVLLLNPMLASSMVVMSRLLGTPPLPLLLKSRTRPVYVINSTTSSKGLLVTTSKKYTWWNGELSSNGSNNQNPSKIYGTNVQRNYTGNQSRCKKILPPDGVQL